MNSIQPLKSDVLIIGTGAVGLTMALLLAKSDPDLLITVVDKGIPCTPFTFNNSCLWDIRTSAITRATENAWKRIGVWERISKKRFAAYDRMYILDAQGFGELNFNASDIAEPNLGHIIENRVFLNSLWEEAKSSVNVQIFSQFESRALNIHANKVELIGFYQDQLLNLQAPLLIGADGSQSWVRQQSGIVCKSQAYEQVGIITTVHSQKSHQQTAFQRFLPNGPLAFLPLADPFVSSIVWTQDPSWAKAWCEQDPQRQAADLAHASDYLLGDIDILNSPTFFPLIRQHAETYVKPKLALIGDAAHVIHPLAGQGLNLGIEDAIALADTLIHPKTLRDHDWGQLSLLQRYEAQRRPKNARMMHSMTLLNWIFCSSSDWLRGFRSFGMNQIHQCSPLKRFLIQEAIRI